MAKTPGMCIGNKTKKIPGFFFFFGACGAAAGVTETSTTVGKESDDAPASAAFFTGKRAASLSVGLARANKMGGRGVGVGVGGEMYVSWSTTKKRKKKTIQGSSCHVREGLRLQYHRDGLEGGFEVGAGARRREHADQNEAVECETTRLSRVVGVTAVCITHLEAAKTRAVGARPFTFGPSERAAREREEEEEETREDIIVAFLLILFFLKSVSAHVRVVDVYKEIDDCAVRYICGGGAGACYTRKLALLVVCEREERERNITVDGEG